MVEVAAGFGSRSLHESTLRLELERIARHHFSSELTGFEARPFPVIGSYDCYAISVALRDGTARSIFLKDFGFSRQSKHEPETRRHRERRVYRDLLAHADLGTPAYYGSVWDPPSERYWLLIELVEGEPVDRANLAFGTLATRWLAEMQSHFIVESARIEAGDFLTRMDSDYYRSKALQALGDVTALSAETARRLERLLPGYETAIPILADGPRTLVHGALIPWHLLVDRRCEPVRVCVYDWELAASGSPIYDLAFFLDDADEPVRKSVCELYRAESQRCGLAPPDLETLMQAVDSFRLHRVIDWLSRSVEKRYPESRLAWFVERAEALAERLRD